MFGLRSDQQPRVPPSLLLPGLSQSLTGNGTTSLCCSSGRLPSRQCTTSWQQVPQRHALHSGRPALYTLFFCLQELWSAQLVVSLPAASIPKEGLWLSASLGFPASPSLEPGNRH
jgi:hypothetical protein